jgi:hypothetical protein
MMGMLDVSDRALRHALRGDELMAAAEVAWLDDGQLRALIDGGKRLLKAAELELTGRQAVSGPDAPAATFTVDGEIVSMQNADGHVFYFSIRVPSVLVPTTTSAAVPGSVNDWIQRLLYKDYRHQAGRKVRITMEVLANERAAGRGEGGSAKGEKDRPGPRSAR